jgi:Xaa-Pro aminopeptidase
MVAEGKMEVEVFTAQRQALENEVGHRIPFYSVLTAGERTAKIGFPATNYRMRRGDIVLSDTCPCYDGYWSDTCNAFVVGGEAPNAEVRKMFRTVLEALELGKSKVRPGVPANEIDKAMREYIRKAGYGDYPHHSGHGVGVSFHEEPRIVPYNTTRLEENMVLALEVGIYKEGLGGIRLEDNLIVTKDGIDLLTFHKKVEP